MRNVGALVGGGDHFVHDANSQLVVDNIGQKRKKSLQDLVMKTPGVPRVEEWEQRRQHEASVDIIG